MSELTWLVAAPQVAAADFWRDAYPSMAGLEENARRAGRAGFEVIGRFVLPAAAWFDDYYTPLLARCAGLEPSAGPGLRALIDATRREVGLFQHFGDSYGYVFCLLRRRD